MTSHFEISCAGNQCKHQRNICNGLRYNTCCGASISVDGCNLMMSLNMDINLSASFNVCICYCSSSSLCRCARCSWCWNSAESIAIEAVASLRMGTRALMIWIWEHNFLPVYEESDRSIVRRSQGLWHRLHFDATMEPWLSHGKLWCSLSLSQFALRIIQISALCSGLVH